MILPGFLEKKEKRREIVYVGEAVSPPFEVSSIMRAFDGRSSLFFDNVNEYETNNVANLCGTCGRLCSALKLLKR